MNKKILIACEESQEVCKAFRNKGFEAYSCDIIECSGGHPEWHMQCDVIPLLKEKWNCIIAFPPCTDLCVSGASWFEQKRQDGRQEKSIEFFCSFLDLDCPHVCIENPIGIISGKYITEHFPDLADKYNLPRKPDQIIQPYQFGHPYTKSTCLWLKNLPPLKPTNILERPENGWVNQSFTPSGRYGGFKRFNGSKMRSRTFRGIALAMAEQWGEII